MKQYKKLGLTPVQEVGPNNFESVARLFLFLVIAEYIAGYFAEQRDEKTEQPDDKEDENNDTHVVKS